jgi:hypothetical protein
MAKKVCLVLLLIRALPALGMEMPAPQPAVAQIDDDPARLYIAIDRADLPEITRLLTPNAQGNRLVDINTLFEGGTQTALTMALEDLDCATREYDKEKEIKELKIITFLLEQDPDLSLLQKRHLEVLVSSVWLTDNFRTNEKIIALVDSIIQKIITDPAQSLEKKSAFVKRLIEVLVESRVDKLSGIRADTTNTLKVLFDLGKTLDDMENKKTRFNYSTINFSGYTTKDQTGFAPLHWAIDTHSPYLVTYLLRHGAQVNEATSKGRLPLVLAMMDQLTSYYGNIPNDLDLKIIELLLDSGADPLQKDSALNMSAWEYIVGVVEQDCGRHYRIDDPERWRCTYARRIQELLEKYIKLKQAQSTMQNLIEQISSWWAE